MVAALMGASGVIGSGDWKLETSPVRSRDFRILTAGV